MAFRTTRNGREIIKTKFSVLTNARISGQRPIAKESNRLRSFLLERTRNRPLYQIYRTSFTRRDLNTRSINRDGNADGAYLTKRILERAARNAFREAAAETMALMGFNVVAKDGWVVKIYADGHCERISELEKVDYSSDIFFD